MLWLALEVAKLVLMAMGLWYLIVITGVLVLCWFPSDGDRRVTNQRVTDE